MKKIIPFAALMLAFLVLITSYNFMASSQAIEHLCATLPGASAAQAAQQAQELGVSVTTPRAGQMLLHSPKNLGRAVCLLELEAGAVKRASLDMRD